MACNEPSAMIQGRPILSRIPEPTPPAPTGTFTLGLPRNDADGLFDSNPVAFILGPWA